MRNYYFDNVKVILIFLVVFGHMIEPLIIHELYRDFYIVIYSFHMPTFVFVTGYFAKADTRGISKLWRMLIKYEIIYAIVSAILFVIFQPEIVPSSGEPIWQLVLQPIWLLWYLLSLIWWRYILVIIKKWKFMLIPLILLIFMFNLIDFNFRILSIGRTLTFLPFFLLGYYVKDNSIELSKLKKYRKILLALIIILVAYWTMSIKDVVITDLYGATSLIDRLSLMEIVKLKALLYLLAIYSGLLFMLFISSREESYSYIGSSTLAIYIYHGLIILILKAVGVFELLNMLPLSISFTILILFSLLLVKYLPKLKV